MNPYLVIILIILIGKYILDAVVDTVNLRYLSPEVPAEFRDVFDADKYRKSQNYLRDRTRFGLLEDTIFLLLTVGFILAGGFNVVDSFARGFGLNPLLTGLVFGGVLIVISQLITVPFSVYETFNIEERYGFNRTTPKTFILDLIKGLVLTLIIGGLIFAAVIWFFRTAGSLAWLYCWLAVSGFELFLAFLAPVVILPLFNKFTPLEAGELKSKLEEYAEKQNFHIQGVYTMDGSRRSTKSNAFFTGFGRFRRIALFDTLIQRHTPDELIAVLAHEIGHYKKNHIMKSVGLSILTTGLMFFLLSFFINNPGLFAAFGMEHVSVYASLIFFGFLYSPLNFLFSIISNIVSRRHEYEADGFSVRTFHQPEAMIAALKKLSADNLSNLTPHPGKVFLYYSHPPVLERIRAIKQMDETLEGAR